MHWALCIFATPLCGLAACGVSPGFLDCAGLHHLSEEHPMSAVPAPDPQAFKAAVRKQWDQAAAGWNEHTPQIRAWLRQATEAMLDMAGVAPGARVLDVAAGAGDQTLRHRAARRARTAACSRPTSRRRSWRWRRTTPGAPALRNVADAGRRRREPAARTRRLRRRRLPAGPDALPRSRCRDCARCIARCARAAASARWCSRGRSEPLRRAS